MKEAKSKKLQRYKHQISNILKIKIWKNKYTLKMFQSVMLNRLKTFNLWLETDFFSHHTRNSSFKISINMSTIQSRYPCELVTHAFFKQVSRFKQQHSQKLFWILWLSNALHFCKTSSVSYLCRTLSSAWEQVLTRHLWNVPAAEGTR